MLAIHCLLQARCIMLGRCDPLNEPEQPRHDNRMRCELLNSILDQKNAINGIYSLSLPHTQFVREVIRLLQTFLIISLSG